MRSLESMTPQTWTKIQRPKCDVCGKPAVWQHLYHGLRCATCPRLVQP